MEANSNLGKSLPAGAEHYRAFIGPPKKYDLLSAMQFNLLTLLGLREDHYLLDIGCGSLRGGKLFIPYLLPERYYGIEPEQWLIDEGIKQELGTDIINIKRPTFKNDTNFTLSIFERQFDFMIAQSIFSHASQQQISRCLSEAKKVLKPTAIFAATYVKGTENYTGSEWVYPGRSTFTPEKMVELVEEQGLKCTTLNWHHFNEQTWLAIYQPENEGNIPNLGDIAQLSRLEAQNKRYKEKLNQLENHPYVKLGLKLNAIKHKLLGK